MSRARLWRKKGTTMSHWEIESDWMFTFLKYSKLFGIPNTSLAISDRVMECLSPNTVFLTLY